MDQTEITFPTFTRPQFTKAAAIIAKALSGNASLVFIAGEENIAKSYIADIMISTMADNKNPYTIPLSRHMCLEDKPAEANHEFVRGVRMVNNKKTALQFTTQTYFIINEQSITQARSELAQAFPEAIIGTTFLSFNYLKKHNQNLADIGIILRNPSGRKGHVSWTVTLHNPDFQTPEMENAFEILNNYAQNRQQRWGESQEPSWEEPKPQ